MKNRNVHSELDHEFVFCDIIDKGEEIVKTYACECGAQKTEVFWLMREHITQKKEGDDA